ncbi:MAG: hypothetical protein J3K34DRAFT_416388 [Monoraphidium minutum]|nr:MAG: hypothetical protein J3K34DRAFT_416388 [Monoraphidium minutum]
MARRGGGAAARARRGGGALARLVVPRQRLAEIIVVCDQCVCGGKERRPASGLIRGRRFARRACLGRGRWTWPRHDIRRVTTGTGWPAHQRVDSVCFLEPSTVGAGSVVACSGHAAAGQSRDRHISGEQQRQRQRRGNRCKMQRQGPDRPLTGCNCDP